MLGTIIVLAICVIVLGLVIGLVISLVVQAIGVTAVLPWMVIQAAGAAIPNGILAIGYVLIYARLREIKEGTTVQSLVEVFD